MSLMGIIKFGYALVIVTFVLMIWASLAGASNVHVDPGPPPCVFQALCTCSKPEGDLGYVECKNVEIFKVPAAINSSRVYTLHLEGNGIRDLEPQFFQATGLYRLKIHNNPLETIHEEAFYGLDNTLWELELVNDMLTTVPSRAIRYLQKLKLLDLSGNQISDVSGDNWRGLENSLEVLKLGDNSISNIALDSFAGLPMLDVLDLHGNHLTLIDSGVFRDGMHRLKELYLNDNQLTYIPYEEIAPLRQLRVLDLSNNLLKQVPPAHELNGISLSLDTLKLENNIIKILLPGSFRFFNELNYTSLAGNPIYELREDAFRNARIKSLSLRDCALYDVSPAAFAGLENSLQILDLSENNLTMISNFMFSKLDALRSLDLRENRVDINLLTMNAPSEYAVTSFSNFQYKLFYLDISGSSSIETSIQDVRRMRSLRSLSMGRLLRRSLSAEDFLEFGVELEELKIFGSTINRIENSAFEHVRTIKSLDLSENYIEFIDPFAFADLHSLTTLKISHGLADTVKILPFESLKALTVLQNLDLSNNKLRNVPDTSFHFMTHLRTINLQDNIIGHFAKGTLQSDNHNELVNISLSFNQIRQVEQHTFVNLRSLREIHLEDNQIELVQRRAFTSLDSVSYINLKGNRLLEISEEAFQNLPALRFLDISFNKLYTFRFSMFDQVGSATALKVNASYNQIVSLADSNAPSFLTLNYNYPPPPKALSLGTVSVNIRVLDLSHNNITYIAPYYFRHVELTMSSLHLGHNKLRNITREVFGSMLALQYLDLSHNFIYHLEYDCFKRLKKLQIVNLSHNHVLELPVDLFRESLTMTSIDLSHNHIRNLADNLLSSPALEKVDLSHNDLSRVPTNCMSSAAANNLVVFDLSYNVIPAVSLSDFINRFRNSDPGSEYWQQEPDYRDDYLYHTARRDDTRVFHQKKQFPQNILFQSLCWLDLSGNHLVRIEPGTFGALPKLKWLDLGNNAPFSGDRTVNIFKGIERRLLHLGMKNVSLIYIPSMPLPKLRSLDLSYNNLPSIPPDTTANLTSLRSLDLSFNDFTTVPIATHSLNELRWLSLSGNPITAFMNTSLYGITPRLEYLDVTKLRLKILEHGLFSKMFALRTLKISTYSNVRDFNLPNMLSHNAAVKNLYINVEDQSVNLGREMSGSLPTKLNNITITGKPLKFISEYLLGGVYSKGLHLTIYNTSLEEIDQGVFWRPGRVRNLTLDLRDNLITRVPNPGTKEWPGVPNAVFLQDIQLAGNPLVCDCGIGWVEAWDRKRRQYLCQDPKECTTSRDDVRFATCVSYDYNRSLSDAFSRDLDCGFSNSFSISPNTLIMIGMAILTLLYL